MADGGNPESLEVFGGQIPQYVSVDVILAECRLVAFETQVSQPTCDIHRRFPRLGEARGEVSLRWSGGVQERRADAVGDRKTEVATEGGRCGAGTPAVLVQVG